MKLKIEIDLDNDAFVEYGNNEVRDILTDQVAHRERLEPDGPHPLRDSNGNVVGSVELLA